MAWRRLRGTRDKERGNQVLSWDVHGAGLAGNRK